jgi:ceramide glucosyltransferase
MVLSATLLEPLTECLMVCAIGTWSLHGLLGVSWWAFALAHLIAWISLDLAVYAALAGHALPQKEYSTFFAAWALRELLAFPIWLMAVVGSDVTWRGQRYTVLKDGKVRKRERQGDAKYGSRNDVGGYEVVPGGV